MAIASGLFWIVVGVAYIIYQGFKSDASKTIIVILATLAVPAAGLVLYLIDMLLKAIDPIFAAVVECLSIIIGYALYLKWWYREKHKRDADCAERERRREEELKKYENRDFSEEEINKMISKFVEKGGEDSLRIKLRRVPSDEEIRDAAIESAVEEFFRIHEAMEKALQAARTSNKFF